MASSTFEVAGKTYRASPMDARKQFHVMRRLMGVFDSARDLLRPGASRDPVEMAGPIMKAIASMPENDADYVLDNCLGVCQRKDGSGWADVWNDAAKRPMYDDLSLSVQMQIAGHVLKDAFSDFFRELPSGSIGGIGA